MNRVIHFEIHAADLDRAQKFYTDVFGWEFKDMGPQYGNYRTVMTGKNEGGAMWPGINGGMVPRKGTAPKGDEPVNAFICTVEVNDIDDSIARAKKAGGAINLDKMQVPKVGWLVYMTDTEGNIFGMLQPEEQQAA